MIVAGEITNASNVESGFSRTEGRVVPSVVSHSTIPEKPGEGGMSVVYNNIPRAVGWKSMES